MEEITEKFDITPDKTLYPKLGRTGYSISEALAELIDNSIDARKDKVNININIDYKNKLIEVEDNGVGMNKQKAKESIILAQSSKEAGQLGQFGLGLKTACMSLGGKFTISTTTEDNDEMYSIVFDEDEFIKTGNWQEYEMKIEKGVDRKRTGTKIRIEKLRIKNYSNLLQTIEKHLSERFSPFIENKEAVIIINKSILKPIELDIFPETKKKFTINLSNETKIFGWTGLLKVGSVERSGFNLYRYKRLIRAHEKLGYIYHPSKMSITGEINLDPIPVTHNKREFITEDPLYIEFFKKFERILKPILAEAQKRHREEKIKDLPKDIRETLKDNLLQALNKVDDFKELAFPKAPESMRRSDKEGIVDNQEKRDSRGDQIADIKIEEVKEKNKGRKPQKKSYKKVRFITINGQRYRFDYLWQKLDNNVAKESYLDKDKRIIIVILNSEYTLLNVIKPDWLYHAFHLTEGIVEVFLTENQKSLDRVMFLRDKLIKKLADVISEDIEQSKIKKDSQTIAAQSYLLENKDNKDDKLSDNQKKVLKMRLEDGFTLEKISNQMNMSRQRVYQLFSAALDKINKLTRLEENQEYKTFVNQKINLEHDSSKKIIHGVAKEYDISLEDLLGTSREKELIFPRHLAAYLLKEKLSLSFPQIAKIMGKRNHTSIMYAYQKIKKILKDKEKTE